MRFNMRLNLRHNNFDVTSLLHQVFAESNINIG